jgi:hypothetical protein
LMREHWVQGSPGFAADHGHAKMPRFHHALGNPPCPVRIAPSTATSPYSARPHFLIHNALGDKANHTRSGGSAQCPVPSAQCSVPSSQFSVPSSQFSVLSSQFSVLSSQFSVLSSQCSVLSARWSHVSSLSTDNWALSTSFPSLPRSRSITVWMRARFSAIRPR